MRSAAQFKYYALDAFDALEGRDPPSLRDHNETKEIAARERWFALFDAYGTHYVQDLTVGGKVIYSRYVDTTKKSSASKLGIKGSAALGVKTMSFSMQMKASTAMNSQSGNSSAQEYGGSSINVMGGTHLPRRAPRCTLVHERLSSHE